jgi:GT2 family glycosyltransferase
MAKFKVELLSPEGKSNGASLLPDGLSVDSPGGEYKLPTKNLPGGWFAFKLDTGSAVVRLDDIDTFRVMEFEASENKPAYMKLGAGTYAIALCPGLRPSNYLLSNARLEKVGLAELMTLLSGRLRQAFGRGFTWRNLFALVRKAFSRSTNFGIRAQSGAPEEMGQLVLHDLRFNPSDTAFADRLRRLEKRPVFLIRTRKHENTAPAYDNQVYTQYTVDPDAPYDYELVLGEDDHLLPDGLLLFAEHINAFPGESVIVSEKYISGRPSQAIAWDPFMYGRGSLPTPYAFVKAGRSEPDFDNRAAFGIISVPTSSTHREPIFTEYATVPDDPIPCSIVIPTRDRADLLAACLAGLFKHTAWPHEVIVVNNGSREAETFELFFEYEEAGLRIVNADIPFNFSTLCNLGAAQAKHPFLVFLNNDVVLNDPDWLGRMMAYATMDRVGAVGAKLYYADGRLQHGGVAIGMAELCGHLWRGLPRDFQHFYPQLTYSSLRSAVTGACLCVSRQKFDAVGGFDAQAFPVTLNDIDLCLKLNERGWLTVLAAKAEAFHLEGESRGHDVKPEARLRRRQELMAFSRKWRHLLDNDPWVSRLISRSSEQLRFR